MIFEFCEKLLVGLKDGNIIFYFGVGVLVDVKNVVIGVLILVDSDLLIYVMNDGKLMVFKLMYEFLCVVMNVELKCGCSVVIKFLMCIYGEMVWMRVVVYDWLKGICLYYVIDINCDMQLQDFYVDVLYNLIVGIVCFGGIDFCYKLYFWDGIVYL